MAVRLCVFDFDGTLCATREAIAYCLAATFDRHRQPQPSAPAVADVIRSGVGLAETFDRLHAGRLEPHDTDEWMATYRAFYNGGEGQLRTRLFPGVAQALDRLTRRGNRVAVVSNKGEESVHAALASFDIARYVDLVVGDRPGLAKKPDPASYREIIAPAFPDIAAADTTVIGDTAADIAYARNIGARACWASYGYGDAETCVGLRPDVIIQDIGELDGLWPPAACSP